MNFLFDAQMPRRLCKGLEMLDQENLNGKEPQNKMYHVEIELGNSIPDSDVIQYAKELNAIIISEDDDFKRIKANKQLIKEYKLGYVLFKPPAHGSRYWEKSVAFVLAWENLKGMIKNKKPPFIFKIDKKGNIKEEPL